MAIEFNNTATQHVDFGNILSGLTQKSITGWLYLNDWGDTGTGGYIIENSFMFVLIATASHRIQFTQDFSTSNGTWRTGEDSISTGQLIHFVISYDWSSATNNPVIYINGISSAVEEAVTPAGTVTSDSLCNLVIGNDGEILKPIDGLIYDLRIYNRILSASEVATIYGMRGKDNIINGLVFRPMLKGAAGLSTFSGALAAGNTIYDPYSQTYGVPNGSPVAVADNQLGW